jgi:aryl-alcohol dehydrogenase-like predicted oxidoreductase
VSQVALNWVLNRPTVSSVVIGARTEAQLRENLSAVGMGLDAAHIRDARCGEQPPAESILLASVAEPSARDAGGLRCF